jgi:hypothetical protein
LHQPLKKPRLQRRLLHWAPPTHVVTAAAQQGDVRISGRVIIDVKDSKAAKVAGGIWAKGSIQMTGA